MIGVTVMSSKIENVIGEIEDYLADCKAMPFSSTKICVEKDRIDSLVSELRLKIPDEIKEYQKKRQKLDNSRDAILNDAKTQAENMVKAAQIHTEELINEHEIMQRAYEQANKVIDDATAEAQRIMDSATEDANNIRMGAIQYTDDMLSNLEMIINHAIDSNKTRYETLMESLNKSLNIVMSNRNELRPEENSQNAEQTLADSVKEVMDDDGPTGEE